MSGAAVVSGTFGNLLQIKNQLERLDTKVYEAVRDMPKLMQVEREQVRENVHEAATLIHSIQKKLNDIYNDVKDEEK